MTAHYDPDLLQLRLEMIADQATVAYSLQRRVTDTQHRMRHMLIEHRVLHQKDLGLAQIGVRNELRKLRELIDLAEEVAG